MEGQHLVQEQDPGEVDVDDAAALLMVGRSLLGIDDDAMQKLLSNLHERLRSRAA